MPTPFLQMADDARSRYKGAGETDPRRIAWVIYDPTRSEYLMSVAPRGWAWTRHPEHAHEWGSEVEANRVLTTEAVGHTSAFVGRRPCWYTVTDADEKTKAAP